MENIKDLPEGWAIIPFGEICEKMTNGSSAKQYDEKIGLPISRIETIWNETIDKTRVKYIAENNPEFISKYALKKNDILFSHINSDLHLGKTAIYNDQFQTLIHGINLLLLRIKSTVDPKFVNYQLNHKRRKGDFIAIAQKSVNQSSINQAKLKKQDFILPPYETQQAIVSKIEELFSELDKGIAELKLAQEQLKVYRQSVLKYAFEGRLTNDNVKDGKLPEGWEILKIEDIAKVNPKLPNKERIAANTEIQFLPMKLVEEILNKIHLTETRIFNEVQKKSYTPFIDNDIVFAKVTPCMENGKIAIVANLKNGIGYGSSEFHVVRCSEAVSNKYLFYYIIQDRFRKEAENVMTGAVGLRRVPKQFLEQYEVPIPKIEEQREIIQQIENRLSVADKMEQSITESLQKAEALRQSILKKAFSGELIKEVKEIEVPKIKNEYFHQLQLVALVINGFKKQKIDHGEMTLAKNLYLLDSVYKIPTGFKYDRWHLGPYPPALKKVVNNKEYFKRNELFIEATNDDKLQKYTNPYQDEVNVAIGDLSAIFSKYKGAERSHKTELLATVCKVIEDVKSTDLAAVRQSMAEWKIELKTSHFKNKGDKFNEAETKKCIDFIVEKGWDRKLIKR